MSAYGEDSQSDNEWLKLGQRRLTELELSDASVAGLPARVLAPATLRLRLSNVTRSFSSGCRTPIG